jgi:hypothetical protein
MSDNKVTLYLLHKDDDNSPDDVIIISQHPDVAGLYRVVYRPGEFARSSYVFVSSYIEVMNYVSDIIRSLDWDVDPFYRLQVSTSMHPSIIYDVADLGCDRNRRRVEDMIATALRTPVTRVPRTEE